jgi:hypothetical protein
MVIRTVKTNRIALGRMVLDAVTFIKDKHIVLKLRNEITIIPHGITFKDSISE